MVFNNMVRQNKRWAMAGQNFLFGMIVGVTFGILLMAPLNRINIETSFFKTNISYNDNAPENESFTNENIYNLKVNKSRADELYDKVKVLCWIMTGPQNHESKARHVKNTWGKRCNILIFMSTKEDPSLPSVALPVIEDRANLWGKTKEAFKYIYEHYYDQADWFFKADDDTYAIMENMRYLLHDKNTTDPLYLGYRFKPLVKNGYNSGGAGYVLSKEALRKFVKESLPYPDKCNQENTGNEDVELGKCLEAVGVPPSDTRDSIGKSRFLPIFISPLLSVGGLELGEGHWLWSYNYYPLKKGMECCSDYIITIHYVDPRTMYLLDYIIYHVKPFGVPYDSTKDYNNTISDNSTESAVSLKKEDSIILTENSGVKNDSTGNNVN